MTLQQIRKYHNVPAKRGGRVRYTGHQDGRPRTGTIVGSKHGYIQIRLDGEKFVGNYHPNWELEYL